MSGYKKKGWVMDEIDKFIFESFMKNAKTTITDICNMTGITKAPAHNRIKRIWKEYITGSHVTVDKKKLGYEIDGIFLITLNEQSNDAYQNFVIYLYNRPEIRSVELVTGGADFFVKFVAKDYQHTRDIMDFIKESPYLCKLQYFNILETPLQKYGIPI